MASQVRPGLAKPGVLSGPKQSSQLMRHQPAYSIRARGQVPHDKAGCMAAISTWLSEQRKGLAIRGRPCMSTIGALTTSVGQPYAVPRCERASGMPIGTPIEGLLFHRHTRCVVRRRLGWSGRRGCWWGPGIAGLLSERCQSRFRCRVQVCRCRWHGITRNEGRGCWLRCRRLPGQNFLRHRPIA
jgi:hypothetical protein